MKFAATLASSRADIPLTILSKMTGTLRIDELGPKGDGIHKAQRERIYVDRALPGDNVRADLHRGEDGILRGDLIEVVQASPHRVKAPCVNYEVCGGCTLQHAEDGFYRNWKVEIVRDALRKRSLSPRVWREPVFLPGGNRRRATFAAFKKNNHVTLGHFRRRSDRLTDISVCLIADPAIMALRAKLVTLLAPVLQDGFSAGIFIQTVGGQFEIVITGPIGKTGKPDPQVRDAITQLAEAAEVDRIGWRASDRDHVEVIVQRHPLRAKFGVLDVALPPLSFLQPTKAGEDALVAAVMELMPRSGKFADLFSGCGTFSGPMLERGAVDAYENVGPAIRALEKSKGAKPLRAFSRDLFKDPLRRNEANRYDVIVFDPPRAGAQEQVKALASSKTPRLIAVSCNPATFARDARILVDGRYRLDSVKVIDQFTWSHHVELVALFTKPPGKAR